MVRDRDATSAGFTLIEVLVVLGLLALIISLTTPTLIARLEAASFRQSVETIMNRLENAPLRARLTQRTYILSPQSIEDAMALFGLDDQEKIDIEVLQPVTISPLGLCSAGSIRLHSASGRQAIISISAPFCETQIATEAEANVFGRQGF